MNFELSFRPPYDWGALISFLGARAISGVEAIDGSSYRRIVRLSHKDGCHVGWIEIAPRNSKAAMRVSVSASLAKVVPAVLSRAKHLMDLSCNPAEIAGALGPLAAANPGLRVPGAFDGFEIAVRAILGQQVTVAAARTLAGRFAAGFGTPAESPFASLSTAFPLPEQVADLELQDLTRLGVLASRARSILELAKAVSKGEITLTPGVDVPEMLAKLQSIPGIGDWTAQYIAMRALAWPDAFPHTDLGVMKALGERNPRRVLAAGKAWQPWRAYAVMHLWAGGPHESAR
ncbi:MAG: DNA-3-methyladenine glycosylase 2 [Bryobacteraceae bacterium]